LALIGFVFLHPPIRYCFHNPLWNNGLRWFHSLGNWLCFALTAEIAKTAENWDRDCVFLPCHQLCTFLLCERGVLGGKRYKLGLFFRIGMNRWDRGERRQFAIIFVYHFISSINIPFLGDPCGLGGKTKIGFVLHIGLCLEFRASCLGCPAERWLVGSTRRRSGQVCFFDRNRRYVFSLPWALSNGTYEIRDANYWHGFWRFS